MINIDSTLFKLINDQWSNSFFDFVMPAIREKYFWIPLYVFIAIVLFWKFKKAGIFYAAFLALNFGFSDQFSSAVIKPIVHRDRPCQNELLKDEVILRVDKCGGGKSFTSTHAANTFAFASLLTLFFRKKWRWIFPLSFFWASAVSFAQVYVGLHYPFDILGGAILGCLISIIMFNFANILFKQKKIKALFSDQ